MEQRNYFAHIGPTLVHSWSNVDIGPDVVQASHWAHNVVATLNQRHSTSQQHRVYSGLGVGCLLG